MSTTLPEFPDLAELPRPPEDPEAPSAGEPLPHKGRRHHKPGMADKLVGVALVVLVAWVAWHAVPLVRADMRMLEARSLILAWGEGQGAYTLRSWLRARDDLNAALKITPANPAIHDLLATLYLLRARDTGANAAVQRGLYEQARTHQEASLQRRPQHGWTWAALAESRQALQPGTEPVWQAWRQAQRLTPFELTVTWSLARTALATWSQAPPDVRSWTVAFRNARPPKQQAVLDQMAEQYKVDLAAGARAP